MTIPVAFEIFSCEFGTLEFKQRSIYRTYIIDDDSFSLPLPSLRLVPDCGREPKLQDLTIQVVEAPIGVEATELYEFNEKTKRIKFLRTQNIDLIKQRLIVRV